MTVKASAYARSKFNLLQPGEDLTQEECLAQADALRESIPCSRTFALDANPLLDPHTQ